MLLYDEYFAFLPQKPDLESDAAQSPLQTRSMPTVTAAPLTVLPTVCRSWLSTVLKIEDKVLLILDFGASSSTDFCNKLVFSSLVLLLNSLLKQQPMFNK